MAWFCFSNQDQTKNGIIDDINKIRIYPFTDDGFTVIGKNLPDATQFHQNEIDKTFLAHVSPGFAIIMVFVQHSISGKPDVFIVTLFHLISIHFFHFTVSNGELNQSYYTVIDNPPKFSSDIIADLLDFFFLKGSDAHGFYEDLVCYRYYSEAAPGSAIITGFFDEYVFTGAYCQIILCIRCSAHA